MSDFAKDTNVPTNGCISRQAVIDKFIDGLEDIFADLRERHVDDSVCGLCEYDGAYIGQSGNWCNECPGFEKDDCFKLSDKTRKEWTEGIIKALPSVQPEKRTEKRTETHACDLISRRALCEYALNQKDKSVTPNDIMRFPSAQPEFAKDKNVPSNDCVSRQAAIDCVCYDQEYTIECLEKLPSAQPEIVRCKDCKYWQDQEEGIVEVSICARPQNKYEKFPLVMLIDGDGFCSYAERRTDETY